MTFNLELEDLARETQRAVEKLLKAYEDGALSLLELRAALIDALSAAGIRGGALGITSINREVLGEVAAVRLGAGPLLLEQYGSPLVLAKSVDTVLGGPTEILAMRAIRLAAAIGPDAGQRARGDTIARSDAITGWRRGMDSDPCQLCTWWSRDGRVWEKWRALQSHSGCCCYQIPV